jgi:xanthine dehydrogenase YagS FAD-binding subunit
MRPFDYSRPRTLQEALSLLGRDGAANDAGRPIAGGTDLLTLMKADIVTPPRLIDIKRIDGLLDRVESGPSGLVLHALTPLSRIEASEIVLQRYTALAEAAALAATPQLRNMATIAGNMLQRPRCWYFRNSRFDCWLKGGDDCPAFDGENQQHAILGGGPCYAVHPSDLAAALLAFDAEASLKSAAGDRVLPLSELFSLPTDEHRAETTLHPDELVVSIRMPAPAEGLCSTYLKAMDRKVWAFALVGVAAALRLQDEKIAEARLALSGVAPIPWRATAAERLLAGANPTRETFERAADAVLADARPLSHNAYKLPLARALIVRALEQLVEPSEGDAA